jgi:cyclophilin family peptidyl-prolyl cis-trans isomerase
MSRIKMKKLISVGFRFAGVLFIWLFLVVPCWAEAPVVELETNFGDIVIELFDANAPGTVANFLTYVKSGFYDGLIFHRVIPDFIIQTGAFDADLNPRTPTEPNIPSEYDNGLRNEPGTVAMALTSDVNGNPIRDSATSGFYINLAYNTSLDVNYTVFGSVIAGMDVVDRIANLPTQDVAGGALANVPRPAGPVIIYKAKILGDLDGDYNVNLKDYSIFANQWLNSGNSSPLMITASDGGAGDWFGFAVAVDANFAIVGAPRENNYTGSAYIFEYNDGNWTQQAKLTALDGAEGDNFGGSVSISANHAIVAAPRYDSNTGAAYIFEYKDGNWTQQKKLLGYEGKAEDWFGQSVSISGDCAIVGAKLHDLFVRDAGAVFIYYRNEGSSNNWGLNAGFAPEDAIVNDNFGYSVSINGEYIIIGAIGDDPQSSFPNFIGSAYICKYDGTYWTKQAKLTADDGAVLDKFGWSVSIDGRYAIVGSPYNDDNGSNSGSAYIFEQSDLDPNNWDQKTKLTASDAAASDYFGCSVAIGGGRALVGAYGNDDNGSNSGSVYIFEPNEIDPNKWDQTAKLTASDAAAGDNFGFSVAIGIGRHAVIGAHGNDDGGSESGSAYILKLCPDTDLDGDCSVTFDDLAVLTDNWLLQ